MATDKKPEQPSPEARKAFQALIQRISLRNVQLLRSEVSGDKSFVAARGAVEGNVEVALDFNSAAQVVDNPPRVECELTFDWRGFLDGGDKLLVRVMDVYLVSYDLIGDDPVTEETLDSFARNNAAFNAWPFFRQSLHSTTLNMGLPAYTLPLMKPT